MVDVTQRRDPVKPAKATAMGRNYRAHALIRLRLWCAHRLCTRRAQASVGPLRDTSKPCVPRTVPIAESVHPRYHGFLPSVFRFTSVVFDWTEALALIPQLK